MKYIGRIITKSKNIEPLDFVEVTDDKEKIDKSIPTLIIGKQTAESIYGKDKIHLLDKKIEDNVYWTFGKLEKRTEFENDLETFNNIILKNLLETVNYVYFNIFTMSMSCIKRFIKYLSNDIDKVIYRFGDHLYVLCNNSVVGISMIDLEYIGIDKNSVIQKIEKNTHNKIINNDYFISKNLKNKLNGNKIIVPYLYFLKEN